MKIAIDVDDVLAQNAAGFVTFSNKKWGTALSLDDYDEHWAKMWQVDNAAVERRAEAFVDARIIRDYAPIADAMDVLTRLAAHHELIIVTSRRHQMQADTAEWIERNFPGIFSEQTTYYAGIWDKITDESHRATKADLVQQLHAELLIDDQLKHCLGAATLGVPAILFGDYSWNRQERLPENVRRCRGWLEVEQEIERRS